MDPIKWMDERVDLAGVRRALLDREMPGGLTWWHTLGSATLAVFIVQVTTGTILAMYYSGSPDHAYDSVRFLEAQVASGALIRGIDRLLSEKTGLPVLVADDPLSAVANGTGAVLNDLSWLMQNA